MVRILNVVNVVVVVVVVVIHIVRARVIVRVIVFVTVVFPSEATDHKLKHVLNVEPMEPRIYTSP